MNSFQIILGSIGGFAGFWYAIVYFVIGSYQQFDKDRSFTSTLYSYQTESSNIDQVEEEELLDEYFLSSNLQER